MSGRPTACHSHAAPGVTLLRRRGESAQVVKSLGRDGPFRDRLSPQGRASFESLLGLIDKIQAHLDDGGDLNPAAGVTFALHLLTSPPDLKHLGPAGAFRVPLAPAQRRDLARLGLAIGAWLRGAYPVLRLAWAGPSVASEQALELLADGDRFTPAGARAIVRILNRYVATQEADRRRDQARSNELRSASREEMRAALGQPAWFDVRRLALAALANADSSPYTSRDRSARLFTARQYLREALVVAPLTPAFLRFAGTIAARCEDPVLVEDLKKLRSADARPTQ